MRIIKKLDIFILKNFLILFVGAFFVCLFVFMMQFTWRYVDELIGKGLSLEILGQFFWHMSITLIPMALPLAVLLASLIAFGNMGERLELLAMKAAGVPLIRIMRPLMFVAVLVTGLSFAFQNSISPQAQADLRTLIFSMRESSPAVEIPEGVFYSGVPRVNLYVQKKNTETGMLYNIIIYKTDNGFDRAQIVLADSGRMEMAANKTNLILELWRGEQFENLHSSNLATLSTSSVPYDRETFAYKKMIIDFDANFSLTDMDLAQNMAQAKTMKKIEHDIDSMKSSTDSIGEKLFLRTKEDYYKVKKTEKTDSFLLAKMHQEQTIDINNIFATTAPDAMQQAREAAKNTVHSLRSSLTWSVETVSITNKVIRRHWVEWHQKMTLALSCLLFFFIGAPLGAIIRKGGLGLPTVISVAIFIIYYIINTSGAKMARDGEWNMVYGMWISTLVLLPFAIFFTYKANGDSTIFNSEFYQRKLWAFLGLRSKRRIGKKEIIIEESDAEEALNDITTLRKKCQAYSENKRLYLAPNYFRLFFRSRPDEEIEGIRDCLEHLVLNLSNSRSLKIIKLANDFPRIYAHAHTAPFRNKKLNIITGIVFPIGIALWARIWRFRLRLLRDLKQITKVCNELEPLLTDNGQQ